MLCRPLRGLGDILRCIPSDKSLGYFHIVRFADCGNILRCIPSDKSLGYFHIVRFADCGKHAGGVRT
jgi:hypothetical protein